MTRDSSPVEDGTFQQLPPYEGEFAQIGYYPYNSDPGFDLLRIL